VGRRKTLARPYRQASGVPTAMMPFYGETADEAATNLSTWLDRAHQHQQRERVNTV
jgi:hypothetical protein